MNQSQKEVIRQLSLKYQQNTDDCEELFKTLQSVKEAE